MGQFKFHSKLKQYRRLLGMKTGRPLTGPQHVSLETTHHCNLRCSFCESHGNLQPAPITRRREYVGDRVTMELKTIQRLSKELAEVGTDLVELSGKGDPIAHPELTEIVKALKDARLNTSLVTNGTLAKPDLARTLVERRLDRLNVSLNAGSPEVYLRSNHKDLWEKAIGFLSKVLDERKRAGAKRPWVRVSHVVTKENVEDFDKMVQVAIDLGVDGVDFYVMGELPETTHLHLDDREIEMIRAGADEWGRKLDSAGIDHTLPQFVTDLELRGNSAQSGDQQDNPLQKKVPCYIGWNFLVIGPDGTVVPCCYCEETHLGNINDESFADIWYGHTYKQFRRASLDMPKTGRPICDECFSSCNRAIENTQIYNKLHPFARVPMESDSALSQG